MMSLTISNLSATPASSLVTFLHSNFLKITLFMFQASHWSSTCLYPNTPSSASLSHLSLLSTSQVWTHTRSHSARDWLGWADCCCLCLHSTVHCTEHSTLYTLHSTGRIGAPGWALTGLDTRHKPIPDSRLGNIEALDADNGAHTSLDAESSSWHVHVV